MYNNKSKYIKWEGSTSEIDSEVNFLIYLVEEGWNWQWPGWNWVANRLNYRYKNNRTATACRQKYVRIISQNTT